MREQAGLTQNTTSYSLGFQMLQTFMQYPDLWPYFYENKKAESDISKEKSTRIEAMALMILDYYEAIVCMNRYNELSKEEKAGWDKYFIEQINKSPAIQAVYEKYKSSYRYTLKIPYEKAIKELK